MGKNRCLGPCHSERSEESVSPGTEILRSVQNDTARVSHAFEPRLNCIISPPDGRINLLKLIIIPCHRRGRKILRCPSHLLKFALSIAVLLNIDSYVLETCALIYLDRTLIEREDEKAEVIRGKLFSGKIETCVNQRQTQLLACQVWYPAEIRQADGKSCQE